MPLVSQGASQSSPIFLHFIRETFHWLPISQRIQLFMVCSRVRDCLAGSAPQFTCMSQSDPIPYDPSVFSRSPLRTLCHLLVVPPDANFHGTVYDFRYCGPVQLKPVRDFCLFVWHNKYFWHKTRDIQYGSALNIHAFTVIYFHLVYTSLFYLIHKRDPDLIINAYKATNIRNVLGFKLPRVEKSYTRFARKRWRQHWCINLQSRNKTRRPISNVHESVCSHIWH